MELIVESKRLTTWYTFKCRRKGCRKVIEAVVRGYVVMNATRHMEKHQRDDTKAVGYPDEIRLAKLTEPLKG